MGVEVQLHAFLTSALDGSEWSASHPGLFTPGERASGTLLISWAGSRVGLDVVAKRQNLLLILAWNRNPVVQSISQSLY
jgi:hypothetical protein